MQGPNLDELKQIILDEGIVCPISGTKNWTDVRQFNLMFATQFGAAADANNTVYLRPETAQGIFVNYLNVQKDGTHEAALRHCPDRQGLPQRDRGTPVYLPHREV